MNILEVFEADKFYISEGLVFLRNSKRLRKLAYKLEKKARELPENEQEKAFEFTDTIKNAAEQFSEVEHRYAAGDKAEAREAYDKLNLTYYDIMKMAKNQTIKNFLVGAGIGVALRVLLDVISGFRKVVIKEGFDDDQVSFLNKQLRRLALIEDVKEKNKVINTIIDGISKL